MKLFSCALVALALLTVGCFPVSRPETVDVSGVVRLPNGTAVNHAKVWTDSGVSTFSEVDGHYHLVSTIKGPVLTLSAQDGYGGVVAVTNSGTVKVSTASGKVTRDIVLDVSTPI